MQAFSAQLGALSLNQRGRYCSVLTTILSELN